MAKTSRSRDEPELDTLFSAPPDRFVSVRNELAAKAKQNGREDLALRIQSMKRPPPVVWLANALGREHPKAIADVLAAGTELRDAYSSGDVEAIRAATQRRHRAVGEALRHAREILAKSGRGKAPERSLAQTLIGASVDPSGQGKLLAQGRLQHEITPPLLAGLGADAAVAAPRKLRRSAKPERRASKPDRRAEREARQRAREAESKLRSLERAAEKAVRDAARAKSAASEKRTFAAAAQAAAEEAERRASEASRIAERRQAELAALRK